MLRLKIFIAQWICGIFPYKHINGRWHRLPFGVSRVFWPWRAHSVEPHEINAIRTYGKKGGVYLDVGANAGLLTLGMRDWAGDKARIYAVEPNPHTARLLYDVLKLNRVGPAGLWTLALSDHCGTVKFHVSRRDPLGVMSALVSNDAESKEIEVPCMTVDMLCKNWDCLDYIKIDVEGAELLVLAGARATLQRLRPVVQVEVHGPFLHNFGYDLAQLFELMNDLGYRALNVVNSETTTVEAFARDTLLDARHPITGENMRYLGYGQILFSPRQTVNRPT